MRYTYAQSEPRLSPREHIVAVVEQNGDMAQYWIDTRRITPRERREQMRSILAMPTMLVWEPAQKRQYRRVGRRKHDGRMRKRRI